MGILFFGVRVVSGFVSFNGVVPPTKAFRPSWNEAERGISATPLRTDCSVLKDVAERSS